MAKKKKAKKFSAVSAVKELSRDRIGTLPLPQVVPDRKKKKASEAARHKPTVEDFFEEV